MTAFGRTTILPPNLLKYFTASSSSIKNMSTGSVSKIASTSSFEETVFHIAMPTCFTPPRYQD
jgi:hypothetical protein